MSYRVVDRYVPAPGQLRAPGEHYRLESGNQRDPVCFRTVYLYRTWQGREVFVDDGGRRIAGDGDLAQMIRQAVADYDQG